MAPFTAGKSFQSYGSNTHTFENFYFVAKFFAHAADLSVHALNEDHADLPVVDFTDFGWEGCLTIQVDSITHFLDVLIGDGFVESDQILLFQFMFGFENTIHDVSIVGEENESRRVDVEAADWVDACFEVDVVHDSVFAVFVGCGYNAERFMERDVNLLILNFDRFSVHGDGVFFGNGCSEFCFFTVDVYFSCLNKLVSFASGADAGFGNKLVDSYFFHGENVL